MRPSTSGRTTCMARSAGGRPRGDAAQSRLRAVERATWNTGQPAASSGEADPSLPLAENAVALMMAAGWVRVSSEAVQAAACDGFRPQRGPSITAREKETLSQGAVRRPRPACIAERLQPAQGGYGQRGQRV